MAESMVAEDLLVRYIPETVKGVTPTDDPGWLRPLINSDALVAAPITTVSNAIVDHQQTVGQYRTGLDPNGSLTMELRVDDVINFIEAGMGTTWAAGTAKLGKEVKTFSIEKDFSSEIATAFLIFTGMHVGNLQFTLPYGGVGEMVVGFEGLNGVTATTSAVGTGGETVAAPDEPLDADDGITDFQLDGAASSAIVTSGSFTLARNLQPLGGWGSAGRKAVKYGSIDVTGTMEFAIGDASWAQFVKMLADQTASMEVTSTKGADSLRFYFPEFKWTSGNPQAGGRGQVVNNSMGFTAQYNVTDSTAFQIDYTT